MSKQTVLCFDHGEKRIGVAVGQAVTATATPLETIPCRQGKPDWQRIAELVDQWQPEAFVIGKPLTMDGERQPATDAAEKFARQLHGRFPLPLHFADERLSSYEARQTLRDSYNVDPQAARIILETWFSSRELKPEAVTMTNEEGRN